MQAMSCFWLLLMTVVSILAKADCQCSEDNTINSEASQPCNQIYTALESALVNSDNLYVLRIALHPTSKLSPTILKVKYNIQLPNPTSNTIDITLGWTDSAVFAAINPRTLYNLQLGILYWPLRNLVLEPDTITLTLDARNSVDLSTATTGDITDVLRILNARLLVYARVQTDCDETDIIGYTWDVDSENDALLIAVVIVTTPIAVVIFFALFTVLRGALNRSGFISLFDFLYGLEIPAFILIFVEFVTSFVQWVECQTFACLVKECTVIAVFIIAILFTAYSIMFAKEKICNFNFLHLLLSNFVFLKGLIALMSISSVPLILLIIVYPALILCSLIIYSSAVTLLAVLLSPLSVYAATRTNRDHKDYILLDNDQSEETEQLPDQDEEESDSDLEQLESEPEQPDKLQKQPCHKRLWKAIEKNWGILTVIVEDYRATLIMLAFFFNVSLAAMLLSLLYMQALLAGASSNNLVNLVLLLIAGLIPGGLVYGTSKALKKRFHPGEQVFVITKSGELERGQYTVINKLEKGNYFVSDGENEGVVHVTKLLHDRAAPPRLTESCSKKRINPGDRIFLKNRCQKLHKGQYKVIARVGKEKCLIENREGRQGIVDVSNLLKIQFHPQERVFLTTKQDGLKPGRYTVEREKMQGDELRYRIRNDKGKEGTVTVSALLRENDAPPSVSEFLSPKSPHKVYTLSGEPLLQ